MVQFANRSQHWKAAKLLALSQNSQNIPAHELHDPQIRVNFTTMELSLLLELPRNSHAILAKINTHINTHIASLQY